MCSIKSKSGPKGGGENVYHIKGEKTLDHTLGHRKPLTIGILSHFLFHHDLTQMEEVLSSQPSETPFSNTYLKLPT